MSSLVHTDGRIVVSIDLESKNYHTFSNGFKIRRERQFNELNRRISEPVNAIVISGENIDRGAQILVHPNAASETYRIHNYAQLSGKETGSDIKYYSIPEDMCFIWLDKNGVWKPIFPYETALRVFRPYRGILAGIEPTLIKDTLYVTSGELGGKVVATLQACDYEVIFQDTNGKEGRILRFRPYGDDKTQREPEAIAIMDGYTEQIENGELFVGLSVSDAKPINELV